MNTDSSTLFPADLLRAIAEGERSLATAKAQVMDLCETLTLNRKALHQAIQAGTHSLGLGADDFVEILSDPNCHDAKQRNFDHERLRKTLDQRRRFLLASTDDWLVVVWLSNEWGTLAVAPPGPRCFEFDAVTAKVTITNAAAQLTGAISEDQTPLRERMTDTPHAHWTLPASSERVIGPLAIPYRALVANSERLHVGCYPEVQAPDAPDDYDTFPSLKPSDDLHHWLTCRPDWIQSHVTDGDPICPLIMCIHQLGEAVQPTTPPQVTTP